MQSARRIRGVGLFTLFVFAALPLAASAIAQGPVVRTKPMVDQQLEMNARHAKQSRAKEQPDTAAKAGHRKRAEHTR
ncbi:MAG: hypothetical protein JWN04_6147 [Myxococcaceae bacterium]|nr:hypothetical protein [Myxococcaceae bacterium]